MKNNKIIIYACLVLIGVCSLQYAHAQEDCPVLSQGYSTDEYDTEINTRLQATQTMLDSVSNIDLQPGNYIILNDKDFYQKGPINWNGLYNTGDPLENITYIILTPGDYRDYLTFRPYRIAGPSSSRKYLLQYPGTADDSEDVIEAYLNDPVAAIGQTEEDRAIIENFRFAQEFWTWVVRGITIRGNHNSRLDDENGVYGTGSSTSLIASDNNIIEDCLFENQVTGHSIFIDNGSNNIIHNCVIRDQDECTINYLAGHDVVGVLIGASGSGNASGNVILGNEIYNVTQAVQTVYGAGNYYGETSGTFIYGNEFYNEKMFVDACGEERMNGEYGVAFKTGSLSSLIEDKVIVAENEFHGWRRSATDGLDRVFDDVIDGIPEAQHPSYGDCEHDANGRGGGVGAAIYCTANAKNVVIYKNSIRNCSNGIFTASGGSYGVGATTEFIEIYDNVINNLYPYKDVYDANDYWANTTITLPPGHTLSYNQYVRSHDIGTAIKILTTSTKIKGNKVINALKGIVINTEIVVNPIEVFDNSFRNIAYQPFRLDQQLCNYKNNLFYNSGYTNSAFNPANCTAFNEMITSDNSNCFMSSDGSLVLPCQ